MIVPKNYGKSLHSFAIVILCKAWDLLRLRFIGVPEIDQFWQEFLDYYCYRRGISPTSEQKELGLLLRSR
jgi:hypothetical protein